MQFNMYTPPFTSLDYEKCVKVSTDVIIKNIDMVPSSKAGLFSEAELAYIYMHIK